MILEIASNYYILSGLALAFYSVYFSRKKNLPVSSIIFASSILLGFIGLPLLVLIKIGDKIIQLKEKRNLK